MDRVSTLVVLLHVILWASGELIPGNVIVHLWEGNVTVTWDPPQKIPGGFLYQVQLSNTDSPAIWVNVKGCDLLKSTVCNIGYLPDDSKFKVRVGVLTNQDEISWSTSHWNNIRSSQLYAPTFNLSHTSYSVSVKIDRKHILKKLFPYGVQYTAYLWPEGQENKTLTESYDDMDEERELTFDSLQSLQVYCARVRVESMSTEASSVSVVQCVKLPLDSLMDSTLIICTIVLGLLGIIVLLMLFLCFLKHPQKMPNALKPAVNDWHPMTIESVRVETVTDKGWILTNYNSSEAKMQSSNKYNKFTEDDQDRRESLDSGVSMERSVRSMTMDEQLADLLVDSGCESLKGTEGCGRVRTVTGQPFSGNGTSHRGRSSGKEDSGLGLGHHGASDVLDGDDSGLSEVVVGDGYRSQSPSSVESTKLCDVDSNTAEFNQADLACAYRSGHVKCTCSAHEYCMWCKSEKDCRPPTAAPLPELSRSAYRCDHGNTAISSYLKKNLDQTAHILSVETTEPHFPRSDLNFTENSLLLLSCPLLLQNDTKQPSTTNVRSFTLDDVELTLS